MPRPWYLGSAYLLFKPVSAQDWLLGGGELANQGDAI